MQKKNIFLGILITATLIICITAGILYNKNVQLNSEINKLNNEKENLNIKINDLQLKYDILKEDVAKIYKTCITNNACRGHYPGVRWDCNNVGDEVDNPSHICQCDSSCNLNATEIKKS